MRKATVGSHPAQSLALSAMAWQVVAQTTKVPEIAALDLHANHNVERRTGDPGEIGTNRQLSAPLLPSKAREVTPVSCRSCRFGGSALMGIHPLFGHSVQELRVELVGHSALLMWAVAANRNSLFFRWTDLPESALERILNRTDRNRLRKHRTASQGSHSCGDPVMKMTGIAP